MRYTTFGTRTGLRVSEYALGTASFGTTWGGATRDEARVILDRFAEAGGTLLDTADVYGFGEAEQILGDLLGADRDKFVLAASEPPLDYPQSALAAYTDPALGGAADRFDRIRPVA